MSDLVDDMVRQMSSEQLIGQLLMIGFPGTSVTSDVLDLIASGGVGNIILFSRNFESRHQIVRLTAALQSAARASRHPLPLLIATDQENGIIRRTGSASTCFPGNMALGAINSEADTEAAARATGEELRALGITMNLAPVVDISNNPANPVIGVRSFGADPELVARLGAAATRGYQASGVAATLKHFPGHGDTTVDSHLALPTITADIQRLDTVELAPFRRAISAGADAVMTAHVALPAITGSNTLPATLAPEVLQGLLRERLGFAGVVITDCLEMRAISAGVGSARGAVRSLQAGADIALVSHRFDRQAGVLNAIRAAAEQEVLSMDTIRAAAARVLRLKQQLLTWDDSAAGYALSKQTMAEHQRLANDLYARSMTIIRDDAGLLPLNVKTPAAYRALVVSQTEVQVSNAADRGFSLDIFADALKEQLDSESRGHPVAVTAIALPASSRAADLATIPQLAAQADVVILLTSNAHLPRNRAAGRATVQAVLAARRPVVGVAVCDPYDAAALPEILTWLATYDYTAPALNAAARVLTGTLAASGTLPVTL
ncbi:MAG: beta-N-acetylhexosaminidase [Nitrososphaerota archaeon]